ARNAAYNLLSRSSTAFVLRSAFATWLRWQRTHRISRLRHRTDDALLRTTRLGLMRVSFRRWQSFAQQNTLRERNRRIAETVLQQTRRGALLVAYRHCRLHAQPSFPTRRSSDLARNAAYNLLSRSSTAFVLRSAFATWLRWQRTHRISRL